MATMFAWIDIEISFYIAGIAQLKTISKPMYVMHFNWKVRSVIVPFSLNTSTIWLCNNFLRYHLPSPHKLPTVGSPAASPIAPDRNTHLIHKTQFQYNGVDKYRNRVISVTTRCGSMRLVSEWNAKPGWVIGNISMLKSTRHVHLTVLHCEKERKFLHFVRPGFPYLVYAFGIFQWTSNYTHSQHMQHRETRNKKTIYQQRNPLDCTDEENFHLLPVCQFVHMCWLDTQWTVRHKKNSDTAAQVNDTSLA